MMLWVPLFATIVGLTLQFVERTRAKALEYHPLAGSIPVLFALQVLGFILVAKHPGQHYLIPLYLSTGLNLVALYEAIRSSRRFSVPAWFGTVALLGLLVWPLYDSFGNTMKWYSFLRNWMQQQLSVYHRMRSLTKGDLRIDYYRSNSPEFAAFFGNVYANYSFSPILRTHYPRGMFAMHFAPDMKVYTFGAVLAPASVAQGHRRFFLFGNHDDGRFDRNQAMKFLGIDSTNIEEIDSGGYLYLDKCTPRDAAAK
jgi:hypothetical protein